jgi:hypothetical protein
MHDSDLDQGRRAGGNERSSASDDAAKVLTCHRAPPKTNARNERVERTTRWLERDRRNATFEAFEAS